MAKTRKLPDSFIAVTKRPDSVERQVVGVMLVMGTAIGIVISGASDGNPAAILSRGIAADVPFTVEKPLAIPRMIVRHFFGFRQVPLR